MKIDKYPLIAGSNRRVFEFVSKGPKGAIQKLILFQFFCPCWSPLQKQARRRWYEARVCA